MNEHSPLPATTDVLIAGAGAAGLTLATALAAAGTDVVLVDKQAEGANTSRACVVHARTLEVLEDLKVSGDLVNQGLIVPRFTVRDHDRVLMTVDFGTLPTAYPYTLMIPQNITEAVLLARLRALGGRVHRPYEVAAVTQDAGGVTATMATGETIRAGYLAGTDGMHSMVREQVGAFTGDSYPQSFVLADVHMEWSLPRDEVMLYYHPDGLVVVAPLPGDRRYRIVATAPEAPEHPDRDLVQALMGDRGPRREPARVDDIVWSSRFHVHHRLAERYRAGRIVLAGDAAHVHSPAGGQGMNTGIQDAVALSRRLTAIISGGAAADPELAAYEAERRPVAEQVVTMTDRLTRIATTGSVPLQKARNAFVRALDWLPVAHRAMAMNLSELVYDPQRQRK
jgi:2-polyprenyl-6-methoxyphenol hydroxylase-like FAD-dependent oxidoreductase